MQMTFPRKLLLIVGTTALAFLFLIVAGVVTAQRVNHVIESIEARYLPMLELGPKLEAELAGIETGFRDAVAAQDKDALDATRAAKDELLVLLDQASGVMRPGDAASVRAAVESYYDSAYAVSARLIGGETGEAIVGAMGQMQQAHARAVSELERTTVIDRRALTQAFETVRQANFTADLLRMGIAVVCLAFVLGLSLWISRGVLQSLGELSEGFARFGEGNFKEPMKILSADELGDAAMSANRMAEKLLQLDQQRTAAEWVSSGLAGLGVELQGDLDPAEVARRSIRFLAGHCSAAAGAFYGVGESRRLELLGRYGLAEAAPVESFAPGEGLVGEASLQDELMVISAPPQDALRIRSGFMEAPPRELILVPARHHGEVIGVAELAFLHPASSRVREFLLAARGLMATTLQVARVQAARRQLLSQLAEKEEHLRRANEDLQAQQRELQRANEGLQQQTAELDSFTYSVSHDLRAPLRAIDGFTKILVEDHAAELDDEAKRITGIVRSNTQKMGRLIDDLLAFSRLGRQSMQQKPVDMNALAKAAFEEASVDAGRSIDLRLGALPPASCDPSLFNQVWVNLFSNAIKYTRPRTEPVIEVAGRVENGEIVYSVRDNGVGFDMKYAHKLFGVFQRLHAGSEFEGTGVGLALVSRIIKRHGGRIWAEAEEGEGARFSFALPSKGEGAE
jgi:signal transduction histidine kinase/HAMP domain-containing protein